MRWLPVLLIWVLAGCTDAPVDVAPPVTVTTVDELAGEDVPAGNGTIDGVVLDTAGIPVRNGHVALLSTSVFTKTDDNGTFALPAVDPAVYTLRVEAEGFRAVQAEVVVEPGKRSQVEVILEPFERIGPGYRPHIHDLWGGQDALVLAQTTVTYEPTPGQFLNMLGNTLCGAGSTVRIPLDRPGQLVPPGTAALRVTMSWENPAPAMRLAYQTAVSDLLVSEDLAEGQATEVPVTAEDADSAHQSFSLWSFHACKGSEHPRLATGAVDVILEAVKDPAWTPTFDEPHPPLWPTDELTIITGKGYDYSEKIYSPERPTEAFIGGNAYTTGRFTLYPGDDLPHRGAEPGVLIPPGTQHLEATLTFTYGDVTRGEETPWSLSYRSAEMKPYDVTPGDLLIAEPIEKGDDFRRYVIPVGSGQADDFYQARSNWMFMLNLEGEEAAEDWENPCYPCTIDVELRVTAVKDPDSMVR